MSKADNKELEEAINYFKKRMDICLENAEICDENDFDEEATCLRKEQILIETVLNYIENSIPKKVVENKIEKLKEIAEKKDTIPTTVEEKRLDGSTVYSQRYNADGYIA